MQHAKKIVFACAGRRGIVDLRSPRKNPPRPGFQNSGPHGWIIRDADKPTRALTRTSNPDVVNFANAEIAEQVQVATTLGAAPGSAPLRRDQAAVMQQLQATPSGPFERMYVQGQIRGHRELLALNTSRLRMGGNEQELQVAQMSLPIIQRHLGILNNLREIG